MYNTSNRGYHTNTTSEDRILILIPPVKMMHEQSCQGERRQSPDEDFWRWIVYATCYLRCGIPLLLSISIGRLSRHTMELLQPLHKLARTDTGPDEGTIRGTTVFWGCVMDRIG